jgi:deoxyhypusine synthase
MVINGQITEFIKHHYRHFNSAALVDAAEGYKTHAKNVSFNEAF